MAEYALQPFGHDVTELVQAKVGSALWNQHRGKGVEPIDAEHFLPKRQQRQSIEEMKLALRRFI